MGLPIFQTKRSRNVEADRKSVVKEGTNVRSKPDGQYRSDQSVTLVDADIDRSVRTASICSSALYPIAITPIKITSIVHCGAVANRLRARLQLSHSGFKSHPN